MADLNTLYKYAAKCPKNAPSEVNSDTVGENKKETYITSSSNSFKVNLQFLFSYHRYKTLNKHFIRLNSL